MSLLDTLINLQATEFDVLRNLFPVIEGSSVTLLQEDGVLRNYKATDNRSAMTTGWNVVTNKYQQVRELRIATTEANFWQVIGRSSYVAIGNYIFSIQRGSLMPPSDKYPYYTIAIEATGESWQ